MSNVNCHRPSKDGSKIELNVDAILEDFYVLGKGIVSTIDVKPGSAAWWWHTEWGENLTYGNRN